MRRVPFSELKFVKLLGRGAFAEGWSALWRNVPCVVKLLLSSRSLVAADSDQKHNANAPSAAAGGNSNISASEMKAFYEEASFLHRLQHPNIVHLLGIVEDGERLGYLLQLAEHGTMESVLLVQRKFDSGSVADQMAIAQMASDVASALHFLHTDSPPVAHRMFALPAPSALDCALTELYELCACCVIQVISQPEIV